MLCPHCGSILFDGYTRCACCGKPIPGEAFSSRTVSGFETSPQTSFLTDLNGGSSRKMEKPPLYHPYDSTGKEPKKPRSKKYVIGLILAIMALALLWRASYTILFPTKTAAPSEQPAASTASSSKSSSIHQDIVTAHFADTERTDIAENAVSYIPQFSQRCYLSQLADDPEHASVLAAACRIYTSARDFSETCSFPYGITAEDAFRALDLLEYDCPELFQLDFFHTDTYYSDPQTDYISSMVLSYQMTKDEYTLRLGDCINVIASVRELADGLSDYEKELLVFDTLTSLCHYDDQPQFSATAYGALCEGRAKCDGIAYAATWLLRELGLSCMSVGAYADREEYGHAWNLVEIDGNYYALDLTQDIPLPDSDEPILHTGFNIPNRLVLHGGGSNYVLDTSISDCFKLPTTDCIDADYYVRNGLYVPAGSDYAELFYHLMDEAAAEGGSFSVRFASEDEWVQCYNDFDALVDDWYGSRDIPSLEYSYSATNYNVFYAELQPEE